MNQKVIQLQGEIDKSAVSTVGHCNILSIKNKPVGLHQTKKHLLSKRSHQENENTIYQMEDKICKPHM